MNFAYCFSQVALYLPLNADLGYCFRAATNCKQLIITSSPCFPCLLTRSLQHSFLKCFFLNRKTFLQQKSVNIFLSSTSRQYLTRYWGHSEEIKCDNTELLAVNVTFWHFHRVFKHISIEESVCLVKAQS